jgi:hypothetical protein
MEVVNKTIMYNIKTKKVSTDTEKMYAIYNQRRRLAENIQSLTRRCHELRVPIRNEGLLQDMAT